MLILRTEVICAVILSYILIYSIRYRKLILFSGYIRMCIYALVHVIFDFITVCTVNLYGEHTNLWNDICHDVLYLSAIWFSYEIFCYSCSLIFRREQIRKASKIGLFLVIAASIITILLPIEYKNGGLSYYSSGPAVFMGFGIAAAFTVASFLIVLIHRQQVNLKTRLYLLSVESIMLVAMAVQLNVPLLLYSGADITCVLMGIYFSLENPAESFRSLAFIDGKTGVKNANCFQEDCEELEQKLRQFSSSKTRVGVLVCDLNDLKRVNDSQGHSMGDAIIYIAAQVLKDNLKCIYNLYRTGGDEFVALYVNTDEQNVQEEMQAVLSTSRTVSEGLHQSFYIALGYAVTDKEHLTVKSAYDLADKRMYENKKQNKEQEIEYTVEDVNKQENL